MAKTLIIGANGQIGRKVTANMAAQGLPVRAMVRDPQQAPLLEQLGAEVMVGDLEQPLPYAVFSGCHRVVFTAGSGGHTGADKTILVDLWGACKAIDMALQHKVRQFVMISARDAGDPEHGNPAIKPYNVCKYFADRYLLDSGLPHTILRPGRLTDDSGTGHITTERPQIKEQQFISRNDVAACIVHSLSHDDMLDRIVELYEGIQPIAEALKA